MVLHPDASNDPMQYSSNELLGLRVPSRRMIRTNRLEGPLAEGFAGAPWHPGMPRWPILYRNSFGYGPLDGGCPERHTAGVELVWPSRSALAFK